MEPLKNIRERIRTADPVLVDTVIAVLLAVAACALIALFTSDRPRLPEVPNFPLAQEPGVEHFRTPSSSWIAYLLAVGTYLPLALRRKIPWLALVLTGGFALAYMLHPNLPPVPVTFGPMFALYTFVSRAERRHAGLIALLVILLVALVPVFAFSSSVRWVAEVAGTFALLAAATMLGEAERNRRVYVAEVEARAAEAERTREEEARRRVDEERIHIAREVHDIVAHSLSIVTVQASAAEALLESGDTAGTRDALHHVRATGKSALAELRSMLDVLRTGEGQAPLVPAADVSHVGGLVESYRDTGLAVELSIKGDIASVPAYAGVSAYRIIQEALTNAVRHAKASTALVEVVLEADRLSIAVTDNGEGADPARIASAPGHGIRGMRERAEALGGSFSATTLLGGGFKVAASIPIARSGS